MQRSGEKREQLKTLLETNPPQIHNKELWIWGAGNTAVLYQQGLQRLEEEQFVITGYVDRDPKKQGTTLSGKSVFAPEVLKEKTNVCVLISSIREDVQNSVKAQLETWNIEHYLLDEVILKQHAKEVLTCYDLFADELSREVYAGIVEQRVTGVPSHFPFENGNAYFHYEDFNLPDEVLIDCGAYIGDTITDYCEVTNGRFKKVIALEGDAVNFKKLQETTESLKDTYHLSKEQIELHFCAVADKMGSVNFSRYESDEGFGSKITDYESEGDCKLICLDEYVKEPYTFIKADIESYEYRMLLGAKRGIQTNKPRLTVCIYHNAVDFYSIPLLVKELVPEYELAIRHHLEGLSETVLYARVAKN